MKPVTALTPFRKLVLPLLLLEISAAAQAADKELLDILLANGAISQVQYDQLIGSESLTSEDILAPSPVEVQVLDQRVAAEVSRQLDVQLPVMADYSGSGFGFETRDGNWRTELQWRAQMRYTDPYRGDPRRFSDFQDADQANFEARRLRMKIGGHGLQPWIQYYFEVDLQPSRDVDDSDEASRARVIDWRLDLTKWDWANVRIGQWKIDLNRERVDSSGRQQFVERSIANDIFTIDRQIGVQLRGHLFQDTPADMRYYAGVFNGEGRGVNNTDDNMMYMGRLQWNFLGRDLAWRQTDVEYTERPTGSLALAGMTTTGSCTRWSSSGCGRLDGYASPDSAAPAQYDINQIVEEFAFKYRGFSAQQEHHRKRITDRISGTRTELTGGYVQAGYFFHNLFPAVPAPLELAARYSYVDEPNASNLLLDNERREYTIGANWFFDGHNSKITVDYSHLTIDEGLLSLDESGNRLRVQWDVSF